MTDSINVTQLYIKMTKSKNGVFILIELVKLGVEWHEHGDTKLFTYLLIYRELGAEVALLSPAQLKERFPFVNTDGVALASLG